MPSHLSVPDITLQEFQEPTFGVPHSPASSDNADARGITSEPALENGTSRSGQAAIQPIYEDQIFQPGTQTYLPFSCDECPQIFNRNHDLIHHKRTHLAMTTTEYYGDQHGLPQNEPLQKILPNYREPPQYSSPPPRAIPPQNGQQDPGIPVTFPLTTVL
jgi:hypothetical protein